jgi:hypothetical protein
MKKGKTEEERNHKDKKQNKRKEIKNIESKEKYT